MTAAKSSILPDFGLLRRNPAFRTVFLARMLSVFSLGLLTVAVPVQVQAMTGSSLQVGTAVALGGAGTFAGLLAGGVLADRMDRRRLILFARLVCGIGFAALAANAFAPSPWLPAVYVLAVWDGFFGAIGMTALMAAVPALVGRENLAAAGALSMLTMRLGGVLSPALGGLVIMSWGIGWNYALAAAGTFLTVASLLRLPALPPQGRKAESPLRALASGVGYLCTEPVVGAVVAVGTLVSLAGAVRVLFPALAGEPAAVGLMYSAVPAGAMLGALTSGWVGRLRRPGAMLMLSGCAAFAAVAALGLGGGLGPALAALAGYGYLSSIASLLQYTLVQKHTPDHLLGRVNSLWTAQFITGDALGALLLGSLGRALTPLPALLAFGATAFGLCAVMAAGFGSLRRLPAAEEERACAPSG